MRQAADPHNGYSEKRALVMDPVLLFRMIRNFIDASLPTFGLE